MWVFFNNAFVSAVAHRDMPDKLMVRARFKGDLERAFGPDIDVLNTPDADYAYRCVIVREEFVDVLAQAALNMEYDNFKNSIPQDQKFRKGVYSDVWSVMYQAQERKSRNDLE